MITVMLLLVWAIGLLTTIFLYRLPSGADLCRVTPVGLLMIFMLLTQYLGYPILLLQLDKYRVNDINNTNVVSIAMVYSTSALLLFQISYQYLTIIFGDVGRLLSQHVEELFATRHREMHGFRRIVMILGFTLIIGYQLVSYIYNVGPENVPLLISFGLVENDQPVAILRSNMTNVYHGSFSQFAFYTRDIFTFLCVYLFIGSCLEPRLKTHLVFWLYAIICFATSMLTGEKAPATYFLLSIYLSWAVLRNSQNLFNPTMIYLGAITAVILVWLNIEFMGDHSYQQALTGMVSRVLTGSIEPFYHYIRFYEILDTPLMGSTFPNPGGYLPFTNFPLTESVMDFVHPEHLDRNIRGSMPAVYFAEMYVNFGSIGVVLSPMIAAVIVYLASRAFLAIKAGSISLAIWILVILHYKDLAVTSFSQFLIDTKIVSIFMLLMALSVFQGRIRIRL